MKVALFITCLADQVFPDVAKATVRVLRHLGCEVSVPMAQTCCGQPAYNAGFATEARAGARTLLAAFEEVEAVVGPSGSCVGMVRKHFAELFVDANERARASELAQKTWELSEFIVQRLGRPTIEGRFEHRVTFHPSCHASRLLGLREEPLQLLRGLQGLELVPLPRAEDCCGFGGLFACKMPEISGAMVEEKAAQVVNTGADVLVSTDAGCLMNIAGHLRRQSTSKTPRILHLAEVLDLATRS